MSHSPPSRETPSTLTSPKVVIAFGCLILGLGHALIHSLNYRYVDGIGLWFDSRKYWLPIARQLANGDVLYLSAVDNKTPLWHFLNYLVYQTGHYAIVFFLLVGVANATVGYLLYRWLAQHGFHRGGVLAAGLYLAAIPHVNVHIINVRSFSLAALLVAVVTDRPLRRGAAVSIAVLFSQVAVVAIPVLLWDGIRQRETNTIAWTLRYLSAGALVGALPFLALAAVYSVDAMLAGIRASFLSAGDYIVEHPDNRNPFLNPRTWIHGIIMDARRIVFVLLPGMATVIATVTQSGARWRWGRVSCLATVLGAAFFGTVLLKSLTYYWGPVVVFAAALAGVGIERWLRA